MSKPLNHLAWCGTQRGKYLHCVPDTVDEEGRWHDDFLDAGSMEATSSCGRAGKYVPPGIFSRMGTPRCPECCGALGIEPGTGTPVNEVALRAKSLRTTSGAR